MKFLIIFFLFASVLSYGQVYHYNNEFNNSTDTVYYNTDENLTIFYSNSMGCNKTLILNHDEKIISQRWFYYGILIATAKYSNGKLSSLKFSNNKLGCDLDLNLDENGIIIKECFLLSTKEQEGNDRVEFILDYKGQRKNGILQEDEK